MTATWGIFMIIISQYQNTRVFVSYIKNKIPLTSSFPSFDSERPLLAATAHFLHEIW